MTEKEKEIQTFMSSLDISREEAEQLWEDDHNDFIGEEGEQMTAKAKKNRRYEQSDTPRKKVQKERKIDEEKKELISVLTKALEEYGVKIENVKNEAEFSFQNNNNNYTVKLIKHRVKKG